jgi:hypothetical protein
MKKLFTLVMLFVVGLLVIGCIEVEDITELEFVSFPKTIYAVGEEIDHFSIEVFMNDGSSEVLSSDDSRLTITGFDTSAVGQKTMTITVNDLEGASINFIYTVVNSLIDVNFGGGSGVEGDPYLIKNPQHLSNIRLALDAEFELANDIDLTGVQWSPIGRIDVQIIGQSMSMTVIEGFSGTLDGKGHSIINFTISEEGASDIYLQPSALFQAINDDGTVKNLTFESPNLDTGWSASALTGLLEDAHIENVHVTDGYFSGRAPSGLINRVVGNSTVTNVTVDAEIVGKLVYATFGGYRTMGGITVQSQNSTGETILFDDVHFTGTIVHLWPDAETEAEVGEQGTFAGLLVGRNQSYGLLKFNDCSVSGTITGNQKASSGFYGYTYDASGNVSDTMSSIQNHTSKGDLSGLAADYIMFAGSTEYEDGTMEIWEEGLKLYDIVNN